MTITIERYQQWKIPIFVIIGVFFILSETIYSFVFANMAYSIDKTASSVTTTYAIGYLAEILVTIIFAGFIDQFNKWKLFIYTQIANMLIFALSIMLFYNGNQNIYMIWSFAFVIDLIHHYSALVVFSITPFLFTVDQLPKVNSLKAILNGIAQVIGPVITAIAIFYLSVNISLLVSIVFMSISFILTLILAALFPLKNDTDNKEETKINSLRTNIQESVVATSKSAYNLLKDPQWRTFFLSYATSILAIGVFVLLWVPLMRSFHGFVEETASSLMTIAALGGVAGGFVLRFSYNKLNSTILLQIAHFLIIIAIVLALSLPGNFYSVAAALFLFDVGIVLYFRVTEVVLQIAIPKEIIGSWYGAIDFMLRIVGLIGIIFAGWAFDAWGAYIVYTIFVLLFIVAMLQWRKDGIMLSNLKEA